MNRNAAAATLEVLSVVTEEELVLTSALILDFRNGTVDA